MISLLKSAKVLIEGICLKRNFFRRVGILFLFTVFFVSYFFNFYFSEKARAQALFVPVGDYFVQSELITLNGIAGAQLAATESLTIKETILDMIVFGAINILIDQLGNEVVRWIEGGFEGQPGFLQDPAGFMVGIGDQLSGQLIANLGLEKFLCDPFQFPSLQLGLSLKFGVGYPSAQRQFYCTVLRAKDIQTKSVEKFLQGDFGAEGGWDMWADIAVNNQNVIGASRAASAHIDQRLASLLGMESNKLDWGSGFLSKTNIEGYIETPGKVVERTLNDTFDSGRRRIEVADEISEIAGALIGVAMKSVMTGLGGGGTGASFTSNYSGGIPTFSAADYESSKNRVPIKSTVLDSSISAISGLTGGTQVYTSIANQGPSTLRSPSVGALDASKAIDNSKNGGANQSATAQSSGGIPAWWEADLNQLVPLNRLRVYGVTEYNNQQIINTNITFLDNNRISLGPIFNCTFKYLDTRGNTVTHNGCNFPNVGAIPPKIYDISLTPISLGNYPLIKYVRLSRTDNANLSIDEVEFFKRSAPLFADAKSTSTSPTLYFNPYLDISALSADGEPIPSRIPDPSSATPLAGITYTTQAPDGIFRPFIFGPDGKVDPSTAIGSWTFTYNATDKYGLNSPPLIRLVTVSQISTVINRTAPIIRYDGVSLIGEIGRVTLAKGSTFDVFDKITARDADNTIFTATSPIPLNVRATYTRDGVKETYWNSNLPGIWVIKYSFVDRFGLSQDNEIYRTITVTP